MFSCSMQYAHMTAIPSDELCEAVIYFIMAAQRIIE